MPTYRLFDKTKDVLVGKVTIIRLAGRVGHTTGLKNGNTVEVIWQDPHSLSLLDLASFPGLEIVEEPLKIDRRILNKIRNFLDRMPYTPDGEDLVRYLCNLEVTE